MTKQELAQRRNWLKARLLGFNLAAYKQVLTDYENTRMGQIRTLINEVLKNWDDSSKELGLTPRKSKRCRICSMKRILVDGICRECDKAIIESGGDVLSDEQKAIV